MVTAAAGAEGAIAGAGAAARVAGTTFVSIAAAGGPIALVVGSVNQPVIS